MCSMGDNQVCRGLAQWKGAEGLLHPQVLVLAGWGQAVPGSVEVPLQATVLCWMVLPVCAITWLRGRALHVGSHLRKLSSGH